MNKLRWQIIIIVVAIAAIAIILLGQQPIVQTIVPEAAIGGVYFEGLVGAPSRYNPLLDIYNQVDKDVDRLIYSRLIKFDSWGNPIPELAETWGVNVTGDVFNITLRENAQWHDGELVTTEDVLFTIDLLRDPEMPLPEDLRALWSSVDVIAFDDYTIQFRLQEPYSPFIDYLSIGILPQHLFINKTVQEIINDPSNLAPVGSGPYQFEELIVENGQVVGLVLTAFEDYFLDRANIDQIVFRYFNSSSEALSAYQEGQILGINTIDQQILGQVLAESELNVYSARLPQISMILLNLENIELPFFQDANVRKALLMGINRNWIVDQVMEGQAMIAHSPMLPGSWAYDESPNQYQFNPEEAIKLLRTAGYKLPAKGRPIRVKDGAALAFDFVHPDTRQHTQIAELVKENWQAIGVRITLVAVTPDLLISGYLDIRQYDAALVDFSIAGSPDPDPYPFWHQSQATGGQNYSQWNDRRASEYLEQARVTPNQDSRKRLYRNFQVHFAREIPALPLFYPVYTYAVDAEIHGLQLPPIYDLSDRFANVLDWFILSKPGIEKSDPVTSNP